MRRPSGRMRRAAPRPPPPLLLLLLLLLRCPPGAAQEAVAPARISTNFNPPNLQAVGDDNPQTMLVSQRSVKEGEWIRITVGSPNTGIIADGVRVVQHEQRLCQHCRIEYTDAEDPREDLDWTALQAPIAGPALFLSLQQRRVRHVRLIAVRDSVNARWHVKDIVVYASTARQPSSTAPTPSPTHRSPPPPPPPPPPPAPPPPPPPVRSPQAPSQVVRTATVLGRGGDCLNNCSGHGTCDRSQRRCRCSMGFAGFDCGIVLAPELSQRIMQSRSYMAYTLRKNWQGAENHCVAKGGHLVSVESLAEERMILATIKRQCPQATAAFIGFTDSAQEGRFKWHGRTDRTSKRPYLRWSPGEPNNGNNRGGVGEDYSEIVAATGMWNDVAAGTLGNCFVCSFEINRSDTSKGQEQTSSDPIRISAYQSCANDCSGHGSCQVLEGTCSCDTGWEGRDCSLETTQLVKTGTRRRTYTALNLAKTPYGKDKKRKLTITEAATHCSSAGGFLPTLANKAEEDQLVDLAKSECKLPGVPGAIPLGLMDFAQGATGGRNDRSRFTWVDGANSMGSATNDRIYARWSQNEPNNAGHEEGCVVWSHRGWNDVPCKNEVTCFLCEHYMPREAKWGQVPIGSAHADDLFCNVEQLLDFALASVVERVEFDDLAGLSNTLNFELEDPPRSVQLLGETLKAARVLWPTRNFDAAIGGFATALSKLYEMKDDRNADLVEARMYRQMGILLLADSRVTEAKTCFAKCAEDYECKTRQIFALIIQHRYEEAAAAIRQISGRAGRAISNDLAHAKALSLINLGDVQGAISVIEQLSITTSTAIACTAGAVYWMGGDMASAANALHACATFSNGLSDLSSSTKRLDWETNAHVCAASAAMTTGRRDIAFEELDAAANNKAPAPINMVALVARATWMSADRDPVGTRDALQLLRQSPLPRPLAVAGLIGLLEQRQGKYAAALSAFDELWRIPTSADADLPEPLADQHVRYAYARSLRQKATTDIAAKAWKSANDALTRAGALLLGTTADFSRETLTQQCQCAFKLRNVKVAARTCDNALKKQPQSKIAAEAAKWAKEEKRKLNAQKKQQEQAKERARKQQQQQQQRQRQQQQQQQRQRQQQQQNRRFQQPPKKNFYAVLGVRNGASKKEIKSAYHKLAMKWHPDKHPNDKLATKKFQEIAEAYEELTQPKKAGNQQRPGQHRRHGY